MHVKIKSLLLRFRKYGQILSFLIQNFKSFCYKQTNTHADRTRTTCPQIHFQGHKKKFIVPKVEYELMHDFIKLYTGLPKFEFGRVELASGSPGGPPVSKVNVEP